MTILEAAAFFILIMGMVFQDNKLDEIIKMLKEKS